MRALSRYVQAQRESKYDRQRPVEVVSGVLRCINTPTAMPPKEAKPKRLIGRHLTKGLLERLASSWCRRALHVARWSNTRNEHEHSTFCFHICYRIFHLCCTIKSSRCLDLRCRPLLEHFQTQRQRLAHPCSPLGMVPLFFIGVGMNQG